MNRYTRPMGALGALLLFLAPTLALAQGLLIVEDPNQSVRLPRPIIIYPPHPIPRPIPPTPPPAQYKIQELEINARITDQFAKVQVAQSS